ncbi:MAG: GNAT family N-acetyltransferase [Planctomycetota bacterium]|jgi:ribosomal protein S18 acetylase RimI-like enzyme
MKKTNNTLAADDAVKVTKAHEVHARGMSRCHIESFPQRFMSEMGYHWLCALYSFFVKHHRSICRVAVDADDKVVGLAVGGDAHVRDEFLNAALFRYPHLILWKFLSKRLVRRVLLQEFAGRLRLKHGTARPGDTRTPSSGFRSGNLLSICVLPGYKGSTVAGKLIESFQLACKAEGYERLTLSVVGDNSRAIAFYRKQGWRRSGKSGESIRFLLDL